MIINSTSRDLKTHQLNGVTHKVCYVQMDFFHICLNFFYAQWL
jgi:hypothetical protein